MELTKERGYRGMNEREAEEEVYRMKERARLLREEGRRYTYDEDKERKQGRFMRKHRD